MKLEERAYGIDKDQSERGDGGVLLGKRSLERHGVLETQPPSNHQIILRPPSSWLEKTTHEAGTLRKKKTKAKRTAKSSTEKKIIVPTYEETLAPLLGIANDMTTIIITEIERAERYREIEIVDVTGIASEGEEEMGEWRKGRPRRGILK